MAMHGNWNPWHGCIKCSEGCAHCYVYYSDAMRGKDASTVYKTKTSFRYPLSKDRSGCYKIKSGERIGVCMTSDFFLEQADEWRREAWEMIRARSDVAFLLLTKRPERVVECLPANWEDGWDNVSTGTIFVKEGKAYRIRDKGLQNEQAYKSGVSYRGRPVRLAFKDALGLPLDSSDLYVARFAQKCETCGFRILCNGCSNCGGCAGCSWMPLRAVLAARAKGW